jgi:hypothetical protein
MSTEALLAAVLFWVILPLWTLAGFADWLCHRRTHIERTSGERESALHIVQFVQILLPTLLGLFFRIDALVLLIMLLIMLSAVLAHIATAYRDTAYAAPLRTITPAEQQIHSYLELLPLFAFLLVVVLHWPELRTPDFSLELRREPLPSAYVAAVIGAMALAAAAILEEWWRTHRHAGCNPPSKA